MSSVSPTPAPPRLGAEPPARRQAGAEPSLRRRAGVDRWIETTPIAAIVLIVALLGGLVWFADRREREEAAEALIRDALWVEQTLRFQIDSLRDAVERAAWDIGSAGLEEAVVVGRLHTLIGAHREIAAIEWRDAQGRLRVADPPDAAPIGDAEPLAPPTVRGFGEPRRTAAGTAIVDLAIPVFAQDRRVGTLSAHVALDRLLALYVPWWISQNNHVVLADRDGGELAKKSAVTPVGGTRRHALGFDPPLPGVVLTLIAHAGETHLMRNLFGAGIVGLAGVAIVSLVSLMRHYRRRLAAEHSLGEAETLRRAMEQSLTVGMRARDLDERIIYVNPAFCRMVGWPAEDLIGHGPPQPYWLPELVEETLARHHALGERAPQPISFETRFRRADGSVFDVLVYEAPLIDAAGAHRGWMGSIIDVTDRKRAEERERLQAEQLTRTGRLTSLGEMASTISHELNQPLAAIASYAAGCLQHVRTGRPTADLVGALEKLDAQAQRAGRVIRRVHDFVRRRDPTFGPVDVGPRIAALVGFLALDARKAKVEIHTDLPDAPAIAHADPILIEQVLINLIRNGIEAMATTAPAERRLDVGVRAVMHGEDAGIEITVADRGCGVSQEVAERLFSPFFSTKPEGMGMGLAICRSIVEQHRGRLDFAGRPEGGTVFTVYLPGSDKGGRS